MTSNQTPLRRGIQRKYRLKEKARKAAETSGFSGLVGALHQARLQPRGLALVDDAALGKAADQRLRVANLFALGLLAGSNGRVRPLDGRAHGGFGGAIAHLITGIRFYALLG